MSAVNISATFKKDERPDNGLEAIHDDLIADEFSSRFVVGVITPHAYRKTVGEVMVPTVKVRAIEPVLDDADALIVRGLMDKYRAKRDGAPLEMTLFDAENLPDDDDDGDTVPEAFDAEGWAAEGKA